MTNSCDDLQPTLFCVPDITGFTRLIATADIEFSKEVIPALLRRLVDANILNMTIGEVEGDAIFFYRTGRLPSAAKVMEQCGIFYQTFITYLDQVKKTDPERHRNHLSNGQLGLKVVIHYGYACPANIKGRTKLIGKDVIITHRLLKNSVDQNEYILLTYEYLKRVKDPQMKQFLKQLVCKKGVDTYDYIGEIQYSYFNADQLVPVLDDHDS